MSLAWAIASPMGARADTPEEQLAAASALFDAKKYAEAAKLLDAFLAANPSHPKAAVAALTEARAYAELKQFDRAIPPYERAIASKDPAVVPISELGLGEAALNTKAFDKAVTALEAATREKLKPEQAALALLWLGQADFEMKRYPAAMNAYDRLTTNYADSAYAPDAWLGGGIAAIQIKLPDEARRRFQTLIDRFPQSEDRPQAILTLAQMDLDAKRYPEARAGLEKLLTMPADAVSATVHQTAEDDLTQALLEQGDYAAASARLQSIIAKLPANDPRRHRAEIALGHAAFRQAQYESALAAYQEAAKAPDETVSGEGLYWAGNTEIAQKNYAAAAALFGQVAARYPKHDLAPRAQLRAAEAYRTAGKNAEAEAAYAAVTTRFPDSPQAADARTGLLEMAGSLSDSGAVRTLLQALPPADQQQALLAIARANLERKQPAGAGDALTLLEKLMPPATVASEAAYLQGRVYEESTPPSSLAAVLKYTEALRMAPEAAWSGDAMTRMAWAYIDLKQPVEAETAARDALAKKLDGEGEKQARLALVQAQVDQKKWDRALASLKPLTEGGPAPETMAAALYMQAWIAAQRGDSAGAAAGWERIGRDYAKSSYAPMALIKLGDSAMAAGKLAEAQARYNAAATVYPAAPSAPEARFKLGSALFNAGKSAEAAQQFDAVAADKQAGDYLAESLYWAGVAYEKAGRKPEALDRLSRLVQEHAASPRVTTAKIRLAALRAVAQ